MLEGCFEDQDEHSVHCSVVGSSVLLSPADNPITWKMLQKLNSTRCVCFWKMSAIFLSQTAQIPCSSTLVIIAPHFPWKKITSLAMTSALRFSVCKLVSTWTSCKIGAKELTHISCWRPLHSPPLNRMLIWTGDGYTHVCTAGLLLPVL